MKYTRILFVMVLAAGMASAQIPAGQQNANPEQGTPTSPPDQSAPEKPSTENAQAENADQVPGQVSKSPGADDQKLAGRVLEQLWSRPVFSGVVVATVVNGVVTLEGVVPSREERNSLKQFVEAIPGVKGVRNQVRVEAPTDTNASETLTPPKSPGPSGREAAQENSPNSMSGRTAAATGESTRHVQAQNVSADRALVNVRKMKTTRM